MLAAGSCILVVVAACLAVAYLAIVNLYRKRRPGEPPLVKGSPIWGNAADFNAHAVEFLHASRKENGKVFTIRLINQFLTIIMDPHSYEDVHREKNFDFDPIQRQVNWNVFSFVLTEPKKMVKDTAKTVRGHLLHRGLVSFVHNLDHSCLQERQKALAAGAGPSAWASDGLRSFASKTMFDAIFNTVFGRSEGHAFNSAMAYRNFDVFHKYFNYFWLGMPKSLFPAATRSLEELLVMPGSEELFARTDLSDYIRRAMEYMLEQGQSEADIKGHNLVYLHVNYNTFRLAFWALNNLLENEPAMRALSEEIQDALAVRLDQDTNTAAFTLKEVEDLPILDSVLNETMRLASGVFMVRYITEDTYFATSDGEKHLMRKGDRVALYPPAMHKDPEVFEDPLVYKYDRFVDAKFFKDGKELKHPIMAFGSLCPGYRYAKLQLKWYVITILSRFEMRLQDGEHAQYDYQYHGHEVLPPVTDINMDFRPRANYSKMLLVDE